MSTNTFVKAIADLQVVERIQVGTHLGEARDDFDNPINVVFVGKDRPATPALVAQAQV